VNGAATRIPVRDGSADGVISVEAAFHFSSRARFLREAYRVLAPGGVLSISDVPTERMPRGPAEVLAGLTQLRVWGLKPAVAATAGEIAGMARRAGFEDVETRVVGDRVIGPALRFVRRRLEDGDEGAPAAMRLVARVMLAQTELLWRNGVVDYLLLRATKPR
jgi:erythromycin 3''-O-methyltransferase